MMSFRSSAIFSAVLSVLMILFAAQTIGQTVTGTISGTVKDTSGLALAGAKVEVQNTDTGVNREIQADAAGHYAALLLPLGSYKVTAKVQGFQAEARDGIVLTVGREAVVDLTLSVGAITQTVEVHGEAALINTTSSTIQGLVSGEQIRELPLNGRSYNDLALLNPGVSYNANKGSSASDGYGVRMSVNGARANNNLFLVDGTVTNDTSQTAGTVNADSMGVEGIREFTVLTHNYAAEFGHSAGGVVNAVTRSGTNQFHGSLYEFLRNNKLDARDFFQPGDTAAFRRNQFGGSIGGPVKKDKIFFFGNYEGFRQVLSVPTTTNVPNAQARLGKIPTTASACASGNGTFSAGICTLKVSDLIKPYLALYEQPTPPSAGGVDNGDGTATWLFGAKAPINENYYMERGDVHISDKDNLYLRYIFDPSTRLRYSGDPYWSTQDGATNHFAQIGETHVFSPTAVNEFRYAFNRTDRNTQIGPVNEKIASLITPSMSFVPGLPFGRLGFSTSNSGASTGGGGGLGTLGNLNASPTVNLQNVFEVSDAFSLVRGKHSFKMGFDLVRYQTNTNSGGGIRGSWLFGGIQSFLLAQPIQQDAGKIVGAIPGGGNSVTQFGWRQWLPAWFVQDDWRLNSRLTLNLGLRHEFYTDTREVNGLMAGLVNITDAASTIGVPYHTAKMNFAPRFGLAWDPTGSGKTSVRVGIGTYFNQVNQREANASDYRFSATYVLTCNWAGGANPCSNFPYVPANPPLSTSKSEGAVQYNLATPTVIQYGLDVQRQLTNTMTLRVGYVGWNGYNLTRSSAANAKIVDPATGLFTTAGAVKPNPGFGNITLVSADTVANYNSLQVEFRKVTSGGLTFQTSYTYAKALSEADSSANRVADNVGTGYLSSDPLHPGRDYGRSATDQRHVLVMNGQYDLPFAKRLSGRIPKAILGGWAVNGIFLYGTGLPLNINDSFNRSGNGDSIGPDRPNLNPGFSNNPTSGVTAGCGGGLIPAGQALRTSNRWFDPCAFSAAPAGTYGNLGRDTVDGPGTVNVNFAVAKNMAFTERVKLQFRAEFFNMLNHPQFKTPGNLVFNAPPSPTAPVPYLATAGQIVATTGEGLGGRNIQFGLKLTF